MNYIFLIYVIFLRHSDKIMRKASLTLTVHDGLNAYFLSSKQQTFFVKKKRKKKKKKKREKKKSKRNIHIQKLTHARTHAHAYSLSLFLSLP
ncbi:hypothetical protein PUN28_003080 [Cardiocondyla obscurior]|uniref:Secreted protein n=1 Tax=Cardiocondyla obscurior TaxID=286306 RepID=A0AAW2GHR1_9HYME